MHKAMLLLDAIPMWQVNFGAAMLNQRQRSVDQMHRVLPLETGVDALGEMRVGNMSHGVALWLGDERTLSLISL